MPTRVNHFAQITSGNVFKGEEIAEARNGRTRRPKSPGTGSQGRAVRPAAGRAALLEPPPGAQGPARPHPPGSFILNPGLLHPRAPARAGGALRGRGATSGHSPRPEFRPCRDTRASSASARGWSETPRRPAPKTSVPQPRGPTLGQDAGQAFPTRREAPDAHRPAAPRGRKSPQSPLPSTDFPRRRGQTLSALPPASQRGPRTVGNERLSHPSRRAGRAEQRAGGWTGRLP